MGAESKTGSSGPRLLIVGALASIAVFIGSLVGLALVMGAAQGCEAGEAMPGLSSAVPRKLVPLYDGAAEKYDLGPKGPSILAAINFRETSFGTDVATSEAGAEGPMAFLPSTFQEWGVDGNGDGVKDIFDAADAIYSAANYLHDSGAPGDWWKAVWDYNHADWYVEEVLADAARFARGGGQLQTGSSCAAAAIAPKDAAARIAAMVAEAERLSRLRPQTEYVWGGSHEDSPTPANGPFDCSSAVSHLLQVGGFGNETLNTEGLASWGESGPGRWVTIWNKPFDNAGGAAHTFIEFMPGVTPPDHRYWGTSGFVEPGHGPGWIPESTFDASYLSYFEERHPPGL
jgi:hypothetical protein